MLMHKNLIVCTFTISDCDIKELYISKSNYKHLPLPLIRIIRYQTSYVSNIDNNKIAVNEEGIGLFEIWLLDRTIPSNRDNLNKYIPKKYSPLTWMLINHSYSLTDCYWTKEENESIDWNRVKLFGSNKIDKLSVIESNRSSGTQYDNVNATLGGSLEKYWFYSCSNNKNTLMLAKRTEPYYDILNIREVIASKIYELQGFNNFCTYKYIRNSSSQIVGCKCKAFTTEELELITAYDLLEEYGMTQDDKVYELIIQFASLYGANASTVRLQLDLQTLIDYLITNRDRHQNNIGFLRNPDTLRIVSMAPIFDNGSSKYLEGEKPEGVINTTVHNLYSTELECLQHISNKNILNLDKLPDNKWILNELRKSCNTSESRIQALYNLYKNKVDYIKKS
jgi:hypothetical protein